MPPPKVYQIKGHDPEKFLYQYQGLSFTDIEMDQNKKVNGMENSWKDST